MGVPVIVGLIWQRNGKGVNHWVDDRANASTGKRADLSGQRLEENKKGEIGGSISYFAEKVTNLAQIRMGGGSQCRKRKNSDKQGEMAS